MMPGQLEPPEHAVGSEGHPVAAGGPAAVGAGTWWGLLGLFGLVAVAYGQTLLFDFVWDDHFLVVGNPVLRGRVGWWEVFTSPTSVFLGPMVGADRAYRPVLALSMAVDQALWGVRPGAFHLSSVLAHLAVVLLIWGLAGRLTGSRGAAFAAGALLAVHPAAVEAVTCIAFRVDLFTGLGMAAVLLLLRGCVRPGGAWRFGGALLAFVFALGSKETAMAIPPMVTWGAWVFPQWFAAPGCVPRRAALAPRIAAFWVLLGLYAALRQVVIGSFGTVPVRLVEMPEQMLRALVATATYGEMTLIPRPAAAFRVPPPTGPADGRVLLGLAVVGLLVVGLLWLRRRHPPMAFALGLYAAALVPVSNLLPIYGKQAVYVAERSLYPALVGWCLFLGLGAHALRVAARGALGSSPALMRAAGGAVVGVFLAVTVLKVGTWRDDVTLWTAALTLDPGNVMVRMNLGYALAGVGDLEGAVTVAREASELFPVDPDIAALAGSLAEVRGDPGEALRQYERAAALSPGRPPPGVLQQAALMAAHLRAWDRAARWFAVAADRYPQAAWPQVGLGWYHEREGRASLAREHFDRATRLEPTSPGRPWFLGQLRAAEGRTAEAAEAYRAALALDPAYAPARRELALVAEQEGRIAEAIGSWRRIAQSLPAGSHQAEALAHLRRLEAAPAKAPEGPR